MERKDSPLIDPNNESLVLVIPLRSGYDDQRSFYENIRLFMHGAEIENFAHVSVEVDAFWDMPKISLSESETRFNVQGARK